MFYVIATNHSLAEKWANKQGITGWRHARDAADLTGAGRGDMFVCLACPPDEHYPADLAPALDTARRAGMDEWHRR